MFRASLPRAGAAAPAAPAPRALAARPARVAFAAPALLHASPAAAAPPAAAAAAAAAAGGDGAADARAWIAAWKARLAAAPTPEAAAARAWIAAWKARRAAAAGPLAGLSAWVAAQRARSAELRARLVKLGPAAVLAYGIFDGLSYTAAFAVAFLAYEARTGANPTANLMDLVKICVAMWAGNNVTRPFRLAGAAALAPTMDRVMDALKGRLRLPNKAAAFALITAGVAAMCLGVAGALIGSRMLQG